jgi:hypothetical protein
VKLVIRNFLSEGLDQTLNTLVVSSQPLLLYFGFTLNKRRAGKAEMNLDPTGSPRHEQTVAVALKLV